MTNTCTARAAEHALCRVGSLEVAPVDADYYAAYYCSSAVTVRCSASWHRTQPWRSRAGGIQCCVFDTRRAATTHIGLAVGSLLVAAALAGCGAGQVSQMATQEPAVNGTSGSVGPIALRNVHLQAVESGDYAGARQRRRADLRRPSTTRPTPTTGWSASPPTSAP